MESALPILTAKNTLRIKQSLLGTSTAYLWVGFGFDPRDNDDVRVALTRELMAQYYPHVPYGMHVGNSSAQGFTEPIVVRDGYYEVDLSLWPEGAYRWNVHGPEGELSPAGQSLQAGVRDREVSWISDPQVWSAEDQQAARPFLHTEKNGAGTCFRLLIRPDRTVEPFGDQFLA